MDDATVEALTLELAAEDEHGLYELLWALNEYHPATSQAVKIAAAGQAIRALFARGLITLHWVIWHPSTRLEAVDEAALITLLHDPATWIPADRYICFAATKLGLQAYFGPSTNVP